MGGRREPGANYAYDTFLAFGSTRNFVDFFEVHVGGGDKERG
jgi:hypothetical protein